MTFAKLLFLAGISTAFSAALPTSDSLSCKANPIDSTWPKGSEWLALNRSIGGLIATSPVAASCWNDTTFQSAYPCLAVQSNWSSSVFHSSLPESIGAPLFANNSCLPAGVNGFLEPQGCRLGGLPSFVLNATKECQVAQALKWAADRNVRVVIKGTGHDLNGRSVGSWKLHPWYAQKNTTDNLPDQAVLLLSLSGRTTFTNLSAKSPGRSPATRTPLKMSSSQEVVTAGATYSTLHSLKAEL
jgi:hypothetical protein